MKWASLVIRHIVIKSLNLISGHKKLCYKHMKHDNSNVGGHRDKVGRQVLWGRGGFGDENEKEVVFWGEVSLRSKTGSF